LNSVGYRVQPFTTRSSSNNSLFNFHLLIVYTLISN
jgi:hypothetical protein